MVHIRCLKTVVQVLEVLCNLDGCKESDKLRQVKAFSLGWDGLISFNQCPLSTPLGKLAFPKGETSLVSIK